MPTLLVQSTAPGPRPGILVAGDIGGARRPFIDLIATTLGAAGYDAIVPEFFFRQGRLDPINVETIMARRARLDDFQTIADLLAAVDWLRARPNVAGDRIGTIGFCLGGTFVLNLAAARDDLATVAYYGFPGESPAPAKVQGPYPRDEAHAARGPMLAFWGDQDQRAGQEHIAAYVRAMNDSPADFAAIVYPSLDHGFLASSWEPGAEGHELAMDSWRRTLDFFAARLGAEPSRSAIASPVVRG